MEAYALTEHKSCARCQNTLPTSEFGRSRSTKDGYYPSCRPCTRTYQNAWREENLRQETDVPAATEDEAVLGGQLILRKTEQFDGLTVYHINRHYRVVRMRSGKMLVDHHSNLKKTGKRTKARLQQFVREHIHGR